MRLFAALGLLLVAGLGVAFFSKQMREDEEPLTEQMRRLFSEESKVKVRYAEPTKEKFQMQGSLGCTAKARANRPAPVEATE